MADEDQESARQDVLLTFTEAEYTLFRELKAFAGQRGNDVLRQALGVFDNHVTCTIVEGKVLKLEKDGQLIPSNFDLSQIMAGAGNRESPDTSQPGDGDGNEVEVTDLEYIFMLSAYRRVHELRQICGFSSEREVYTAALAFYEWCMIKGGIEGYKLVYEEETNNPQPAAPIP